MSIRLRYVVFPDGAMGYVAICAARSVAQPGDIYLDDAHHHALSVKFSLDHASMGFFASPYAGSEAEALMEREESNNAPREEWDRTFGAVEQMPRA